MDEDLDGDVDFDFFDSPKQKNSPKKPPTGKETSGKRSSDLQNGDRPGSSKGRKKIDAHVPRVKVVDKHRDSSDSESDGERQNRSFKDYKKAKQSKGRKDSFSSCTEIDSTTGKELGKKNAWDDEGKTGKKDKNDNERNHKTSHKKHRSRSPESDQSGGSTGRIDYTDDESPRHRRKQKSRSRSRSRSRSLSRSSYSGSDRGHHKSRRHSRRSRSRSRSRSSGSSYSSSCSGSSSCSSTGSSRSRSRSEKSDNDMTDVSPLPSPHKSPRQSSRKKFRDISPGDSRGRNHNRVDKKQNGTTNYREQLLNGNSDSIDLKLLMQAVLDLDREREELQQQRKAAGTRFVLVPNHSTKNDRKNYSFDNARVRQIDTENQRLLNKIMGEQKTPKKKKKVPTSIDPPVRRITHATVNRQREQRRIETENLAFLKRLQGVRATQGMSRQEQLTDYRRQVMLGIPTYTFERTQQSRASNPYSKSASLGKKSQSVTSLRPSSAKQATGDRPLSGYSRPQSGKARPQSAKMKSSKPAWEPGW